MMAKRNDKRSRLVLAADKLFHEQGVNITTLANIAQLADVPLGNVYYYFKSKDSIITAVIEHRRQQLKTLFSSFEQSTDPKARLLSLIRHATEISEDSFTLGDALGSLCQELAKQGGAMATAAADLMTEVLSWIEVQFKAIHKNDKTARICAINLICGLQGMGSLALTFRDASVLAEQAQYLNDWVLAQ